MAIAVSKLKKNNLKTYYLVVSTYDDKGHTTANIVEEREAIAQPENKYFEKRDKDVYFEWYDNYAEARQAVEDARNA